MRNTHDNSKSIKFTFKHFLHQSTLEGPAQILRCSQLTPPRFKYSPPAPSGQTWEGQASASPETPVLQPEVSGPDLGTLCRGRCQETVPQQVVSDSPEKTRTAQSHCSKEENGYPLYFQCPNSHRWVSTLLALDAYENQGYFLRTGSRQVSLF